jgi:hypothetical protein
VKEGESVPRKYTRDKLISESRIREAERRGTENQRVNEAVRGMMESHEDNREGRVASVLQEERGFE